MEELNRNVEYTCFIFALDLRISGGVFCGLRGRRVGRDGRFSGRDYLIGQSLGINGRDQ